MPTNTQILKIVSDYIQDHPIDVPRGLSNNEIVTFIATYMTQNPPSIEGMTDEEVEEKIIDYLNSSSLETILSSQMQNMTMDFMQSEVFRSNLNLSVETHMHDWMEQHPIPQPVIDPSMVQNSIAEYFLQNPIPIPLDGEDGEDGDDGANATDEQIYNQLVTYFLNNPLPVPQDGEDGDDGQNATPEQVASAVNSYFLSHPIPIPADGKSVDLRVYNGFVQYRQEGGSWNNLISFSDITPSASVVAAKVAEYLQANPPAKGDDGKPAELRVSSGKLQWRLQGSESWIDLLVLNTLQNLQFVGTIVISQTAIVAIAAGPRVLQIARSGLAEGDSVLVIPKRTVANPNGVPLGYLVHHAVVSATNTLQVTMTAPLLALGASYSFDCNVFKIINY